MCQYQRAMKRWTDRELRYVLKYEGKKTFEEMARYLKRPPGAIQTKIKKYRMKENKHEQ